MIDRIEALHRLVHLMERVGSALWYGQALEDTAAHYVLVSLREARGAGRNRGETILREIQRRPLGPLLHELIDATLVDEELARRMLAFLDERNWLVHHMWRENRGVIYARIQLQELLARLEAITAEAQALNRELGQRVEEYVVASGVDREALRKEAEEIARSWGVLS